MLANFTTGSALHLASLGVAFVLVVALALFLRRHREGRWQRRAQRVIGWGCLVVWIVNTTYWCWPSRFHWHGSLPIHFCNLANLLGALAVLSRWRPAQALLYFWAFALCVWAFVTPTLEYGPGHVAFWIFWIYHLFIFFAAVEVLVVDRFRPTTAEFHLAGLTTGIYATLLGVLNWKTGWSYGFVAEARPEAPTVLALLGPYPWSIVWLYTGVALVFTLLMTPFWVARRRRTGR